MRAKDQKAAANRRKLLAKSLAEEKRIHNSITNAVPSFSGQQQNNKPIEYNSDEDECKKNENDLNITNNANISMELNDVDLEAVPLAQSTPNRGGRNVNCSLNSLDGSRTITLNENQTVNGSKDLENVQAHNLLVEQTSENDEEVQLSGRRIVKIGWFLRQIATIGTHDGPFNCSFADMKVIAEIQRGFEYTWKFLCKVCGVIKIVTSDDSDMNTSTAAVTGAITAGVGLTAIEKIMASLDIPSISPATYSKHHEKICQSMEEISLESMRSAAEEEAKIAIEQGNVLPDGTPMIMVVADGAWAKRSYQHRFSSLGGAAAIIGFVTKKVLFVGVRNKFCVMCTKAENCNEDATEHICFKNYPKDQPASSMESDVIVEGFMRSLIDYNLVYSHLIADGDSSVYKKIVDANPYKNLTVRKIECKNHLLRNFQNKILTLAGSKCTNGGKEKAVKNVVKRKADKLRKQLNHVVKMRHEEGVNDESITSLRNDILNAPNEVFSSSEITEMKKFGILAQLTGILTALAQHSSSLIHNVTNNVVESYNAVLAGLIGGKRVNYTARQSYHARVACATVKFNEGRVLHKLHKHMTKFSPGKHCKLAELRLVRRGKIQKRRPYYVKKLKFSGKSDKNYGVNAQKPDLHHDQLEIEKADFVQKLQVNAAKIDEIEKATKEQSNNPLWIEMRRKLLTASNFHGVCRTMASTNTANKVKAMLYGSFDTAATRWGKAHEYEAKQLLAKTLNQPINECGLFIHPNHPFLGASPDGLCGDDTIVEIKCPYSLRNTDCSDLSNSYPTTMFRNGKIETKHAHYYQVQGQLEVTNKSKCIYAVWTPKTFTYATIERDSAFFNSHMFEKLKKFYFNCLLPELIDPRHNRSMGIRALTIDGRTAPWKKSKPTNEVAELNNTIEEDEAVLISEVDDNVDGRYNSESLSNVTIVSESIDISDVFDEDLSGVNKL